MLDSIVVEVADSDTGPWVSALNSAVSPLWYRVFLFDQYGSVFDDYTDILLRITGPFDDTYAGETVTDVNPAELPEFTAAGLHTIFAYWDEDASGTFTAGELSSPAATVTVP